MLIREKGDPLFSLKDVWALCPIETCEDAPSCSPSRATSPYRPCSSATINGQDKGHPCGPISAMELSSSGQSVVLEMLTLLHSTGGSQEGCFGWKKSGKKVETACSESTAEGTVVTAASSAACSWLSCRTGHGHFSLGLECFVS